MGRALRCDLGETPVSCTKTATNSNQLLSFAFVDDYIVLSRAREIAEAFFILMSVLVCDDAVAYDLWQ